MVTHLVLWLVFSPLQSYRTARETLAAPREVTPARHPLLPVQEAVRRKWSMSRHCSPRAAAKGGGAGQRATPAGGSPQAPFGSISEVDYEANGVGEAHVGAGTGSAS